MGSPTTEHPAPRPEGMGAPAACTIIARNYLSYACVLAESYLLHEPGARFYLLVVDDLPPETELPPGVHLVVPEELGLPSFFEMCFKYDVTELCTAVKPALLSLLLTRYGEPSIIYFDPDILVLRPLDELKAAMAAADAILIPHLLDPIPPDGYKPSEQDILIAGAYNLGFLALKASETSSRLLAWWADRLVDACRVDPARGLFVDQRWMDLAPGLFPSLAILRDPTYDVAYWNVHTRLPERRGSQLVVAARPLAFFHFSGFDPRQPQTLSKHQTRTTVRQGSPLAELLRNYAEMHRKRGYEVSSQWAYGYSRFSNGVPVSVIFRRLYLGLEAPRRNAFGNPFQVDGAGCFFEWAARPQAQLGGLNPFLDALYRIRTDLPAAFPDVRGRDRPAFLEWARGQGSREMDYPPSIVPEGEAAPQMAPDPSSSASPALAPRAPTAGVNVAGYLRNETGLGAIARGYVAALRSAGVPVALRDFSALSPNRSQDPTVVAFDETHPHPVNLICANADQHFVVSSQLGDAFFRNRWNIGVWFWELPEFPPEWTDRFPHYDEIWAPSSFIANALSAVSPIPVVRMPPVLAGDAGGDRGRGRARLGAVAQEFVWLFVFDFHSYADRKNPLGLIAAFKKAFTATEPVRLVIKCVNSSFDAKALRAMEEAAHGHRVSIHDGYWSRDEMRDLLAACDGYASLHRSEGLGVPLATAMSLGRPVVATDWSGNTDFMNAGNSFPVRYELVKLRADVGPYRASCEWANPSIDHAAELLRHVFEGGKDVAARAEAGRQTIATHYSVDAVARSLQKRLTLIGQRGSNPVASPTAGPGSTARSNLVPVLPPMDFQTSRHGWWGRTGKRLAALLLRYHTFHQQRVNGILASSIGDLAARLASLTERADRNEVQSRQDAEATTRSLASLDSLASLAALAALDSRARQISARVEDVELAVIRAEETAATAVRNVRQNEIEARETALRSLQAQVEQTSGRVEEVAAHTGEVVRALEQALARTEVRTAAEGDTRRSLEATVQHALDRVQRLEGTSAGGEQTTRAVRAEIEAAARAVCVLEARLQAVWPRVDALESAATDTEQTAQALRDTTVAVDAVRSQAQGMVRLLDAARTRVEEVATEAARLGHRFAVRPYMGVDPFGATGDLEKPMGYGAETARTARLPRFEDLFRGPEHLVAERQRPYLPLLDGVGDVVDLGCGRGEFVDLLARAGITALGVEKDAELVARAQARGRRVVQADAFQYLRRHRAKSLGAIFSAQFIEHLLPEQLLELLALASTRLRQGGLFIAETPNPESFEALKAFHVDLTHQKPIYPQVLLHLCLQHGFESARIFYPAGGGFTQRHYESAGEYAVVATR